MAAGSPVINLVNAVIQRAIRDGASDIHIENGRSRARIRLHPSKTVGDYARDLRRVQSPLAPRYREFARLYEVVIYGVGTCDADRWASTWSSMCW